MTTSGTYTFAPQVDDLVLEAYERLGLNDSTMTGEVARAARRSLALQLIDWTNRGVNTWQMENWFTSTVIGSQILTAPTATVDILDLYVNVSGSDIMLSPIGRDAWASIPNKSLTGRPTQYWIERRADTPVIHLWPVPDAVYTLSVYRMRQPQDVSGMTQTPDAPLLWMEAIAAALAARLAEKYAPSKFLEKRAIAKEAFEAAASENRERVPLSILPDLR